MSAKIDVDVRAQPFGVEPLSAYLPKAWREYLGIGRDLSSHGAFRFALPTNTYLTPAEAARHSTSPDPVAALLDYLDAHDVEIAVLAPPTAAAVGGLSYPALAVELARAANEWTVAEWLDADPRLRGSILVDPRDPKAAAAEIRKWALEPRLVQVLLANPPGLLGQRTLHEVYKAAAERALPVLFQAGGGYTGLNAGGPAVGDPGSLFEYRLAVEYEAQPHVLSLIGSGIFERYPDLRIILSGFGIGWLPSLLSRMDREFHAARTEPPARVTRLPSDTVQTHLRFTTDGLDAAVLPLLAGIEAQHLLVHSAGYPRPGWDGRSLLEDLPPRWEHRVAHANAWQLYEMGATQSVRG